MVSAVTELYVLTKTNLRANAGVTKDFEVGVGVHLRWALSLLLFITMMEEEVKEARRGGPCELLYADDLVLTADAEERVIEMFKR